MYRSMYTINFNNKNSYYDLGLKIPHRPNIPVAEKEIKIQHVDGRDGDLHEEFGYKDIEIPISFYVIDRIDINNKCRQIKAWLNGDIDDKKLVFSDDREYFYKVKYVKFNNIERSLKVLGRFTAVFVCEPFNYLKEGLEIITLTQPTSIFNLGTYKSEPIVTVYGTGNLTLTIISNNITLTNVQDYITINSVLKDCYKDNILCNFKMNGHFPVLLQGENTINWQGNIKKIELMPNLRCL